MKFSAYDFSIYGGLSAAVENISPDTVVDEKGNAFYLVRVRTQQEQDAYLEHLREVYRQHQEALDAFRNRHPELFEETQDVTDHEVTGT